MALSTVAWVTLLISLLVVPGVALVVLVRSLRTEDRKLELLTEQDAIDEYSPRALADLRQWIRAHPDDPYADVARSRYDECVRTLREIDEPYYDWSEDQIAELELFEEDE